MPEELRILMLGPLVVLRDGRPLVETAWRSRQERRLLTVLLTARGTTVPTERLVGWLWPGAEIEAAAVTLRSAISSLRRTLDPVGPSRASSRYIETRSGGYAWNPAGGASVDVDEFLALLQTDDGRRAKEDGRPVERGRPSAEPEPRSPLALRRFLIDALRRAIDLYRGDFLEDEPDAPWARGERDRLRERYLQAIQTLAELLIDNGDYVGAVAIAQRGLQHDPLREPICRSLMRAQALSGDTAAALQSYERYRVALDDALGAMPAAQTRDLHTAILRGEVAAIRGRMPGGRVQPPAGSDRTSHESEVPPIPHPPSPTPHPPPLVGRDQELTALHGWISEFIQGRGGVVTIVGEAGIGKTRLAEEARRIALDRGALVLSVRSAVLERALPFASISEALRPLLRVAPEATLRRLPQAALAQTAELLPLLIERLPDLPALPPATPAERHNRLLDGLVDLALALAQEQPLAVICDDAQWADEATLTAIGRLARRAPRRALLVMLIYRSEELADNPALHALLRSLGREMLLRPLLPARLTRNEIARYLATMADAEPGPIQRLANRLVARTGGNPLFVTVALQALLEEYQAASLAELLPSLANDAPLPDLAEAPPIRDLVLARLSRLSERARELIEQIAVIGRPVSLDLVEQLAGAAALDDAQLLLDRQFLVEDADSRLTFGHELVRSTIAASLASPRRRRLHRRAAEAIAALYGDHPGKAAELALHFAAAGRGTEAEVLRHALRAGDQARRSFGYRQALDQYTAAITAAERLGDAAPADEVHRAFAGRLLTYEALLDWNGMMATSAHYKRWRAAYHPATPAPDEEHPEPLVTPRRLVLLRALMGDLAGAAVLSAERENGKPEEREGGQTAEPWRPRAESPILRDMLRRTTVILQPRTPVEATPGGLRSSVAPMYPCLPALPLPGDPAHDLPALLGPDDAALALFQVGWAALMQGLLSQAEPCLQRAFDLGIETGQAAAAVVSALQLSHLYGLRGSAEERDEWLQQSLDLAQRAQEAAWASIWPRIHQGFVWLLDDQIGAALQRFEHLEVQLVDLPTFQSHRAGVQVGLGLVALARGDLSGAARRLRDALAAPQALYGYVYTVAQHGMAQIAARRGDLQTARDTLAHTLDDSARRGLVAEYVRTAIEIARIERDYGDPALTLLLLRSAADLAAEAGMRPLAEAAATLLAKLS